MPRVTRSPARRRRHKRILKAASGYWGARSRLYRFAKQAVTRSLAYAYRDRRDRKREFRALWIVRVNAACRQRGIAYNRFIHGLAKAGVAVNRKMLAEIAIADAVGFDRLVAVARGAAS
ncbi:MAG TPA: 50S ribosomal protein L20 [Planctomycetota bacterium]|nr:50S ribosomal protein L20 [Planctomycetota bacterium]